MQPNHNINQSLIKTTQQAQIVNSLAVRNTYQHIRQGGRHLNTTQHNILPGHYPENSLIFREALRMNLPHHLVSRSVRNRLRTHGSNYSDLKDLVADLFAVSSSKNQEVPMETNQLEDAMMMNSPVVKKALISGVPPHLIKPKLHAKILATGTGYASISELLGDLKQK